MRSSMMLSFKNRLKVNMSSMDISFVLENFSFLMIDRSNESRIRNASFVLGLVWTSAVRATSPSAKLSFKFLSNNGKSAFSFSIISSGCIFTLTNLLR